jgi:hypothetical protein
MQVVRLISTLELSEAQAPIIMIHHPPSQKFRAAALNPSGVGMRNEIKAESLLIAACLEDGEHVQHRILKGQTIAMAAGNRCANKNKNK